MTTPPAVIAAIEKLCDQYAQAARTYADAADRLGELMASLRGMQHVSPQPPAPLAPGETQADGAVRVLRAADKPMRTRDVATAIGASLASTSSTLHREARAQVPRVERVGRGAYRATPHAGSE